MNLRTYSLRLTLAAFPLIALPVNADDATPLPQRTLEVGFSPEGGAEELVVDVINAAESTVRLACYSFTSPTIVRALVRAKRRGVNVAVMVDYSSGTQATSTHALNLLVSEGIPTRTVDTYSILHDKYIVVDDRHVETGSFNFTRAAARHNSENVLVVWNDPDLASRYTAHWASRWQQGRPYRRQY
jgi:phosphatidylserine/phosphatidylglycerophosphate/cardiolipin synthase-like enzyme